MNDPGDEDDRDDRIREIARFMEVEIANLLRPFIARPATLDEFRFEMLAIPQPRTIVVLHVSGARTDHDGGDEDDGGGFVLLGAPLRVVYGRA